MIKLIKTIFNRQDTFVDRAVMAIIEVLKSENKMLKSKLVKRKIENIELCDKSTELGDLSIKIITKLEKKLVLANREINKLKTKRL